MNLIGLEINDCGLMAAIGEPPRLVAVDGTAIESPGTALAVGKQIVVGLAAQEQAHLLPHQVDNRFWDRLANIPLDRRAFGKRSVAELAFAHLKHVWQHLEQLSAPVVMAVPGFWTHTQLGLIVAMAQELRMPLAGFVTQPLAAVKPVGGTEACFFVDIYQHRTEIALLRQDQEMALIDSVALEEKGMLYLYRKWADAIGKLFIAGTRYDPFHSATGEQSLYDQITPALQRLQVEPSTIMAITSGSQAHRITLTQEPLAAEAQPLCHELQTLMQQLLKRHRLEPMSVVCHLSHRMAAMPGLQTALASSRASAAILEAAPGSAAMGVLALWPVLPRDSSAKGVALHTRCPLDAPSMPAPAPKPNRSTALQPPREATHLLSGNRAFLIREDRPLLIGLADNAPYKSALVGYRQGAEAKICGTLIKQKGQVVFQNKGEETILIDGRRADGLTALVRGQTLTIAGLESSMRLIACVDQDEAAAE